MRLPVGCVPGSVRQGSTQIRSPFVAHGNALPRPCQRGRATGSTNSALAPSLDVTLAGGPQGLLGESPLAPVSTDVLRGVSNHDCAESTAPGPMSVRVCASHRQFVDIAEAAGCCVDSLAARAAQGRSSWRCRLPSRMFGPLQRHRDGAGFSTSCRSLPALRGGGPETLTCPTRRDVVDARRALGAQFGCGTRPNRRRARGGANRRDRSQFTWSTRRRRASSTLITSYR